MWILIIYRLAVGIFFVVLAFWLERSPDEHMFVQAFPTFFNRFQGLPIQGFVTETEFIVAFMVGRNPNLELNYTPSFI